jgi:hypothetical protein
LAGSKSGLKTHEKESEAMMLHQSMSSDHFDASSSGTYFELFKQGILLPDQLQLCSERQGFSENAAAKGSTGKKRYSEE